MTSANYHNYYVVETADHRDLHDALEGEIVVTVFGTIQAYHHHFPSDTPIMEVSQWVRNTIAHDYCKAEGL